MNKKGQALIEFILILPVLLLIIISMIDIGNIFLNKYELNKDMQTVANLYLNDEKNKLATYLASEDLTLNEDIKGDIITLNLKKSINITAPFLNKILGENYEIETSKIIYEKEDETYE